MMVIENNRYLTLEEYSKGLRKTDLSDEEVERILHHERAHFEKALELGYSPLYFLSIAHVKSPPLCLTNSIVFRGKRPTPKDMIKILLAPEEPSENDLYMAKKLKRNKRT